MKEKILVTGGAGFIGSNLCENLLESGYEVISLDNFNDYYDPKIKENNIKKALSFSSYKLYKGDIRDFKVLYEIFDNNKIKKVIHLAAMAGVRNSLKDPIEYVDTDIKGTVNMLEFSRRYGIKKFIFASSSSVYGINKKIPFCEKDSVDLQVSPYATAKRCGELYCKMYSQIYNMSISCLRFFTVYGPRQRPEMAIHLFTKLIDEGKPVPVFGRLDMTRDYTFIDDIIQGIKGALTAEYDFEIFNLGNSNQITLEQLIETIENKLGKKAIIDKKSVQLGDVPRTCADILQSKQIIGYNPKVSFEEGIELFVSWYKNNKLKE